MSNIPFCIKDDVIVRSPIYPFKSNTTVDDISNLLNDEYFLEAIYIASPLLYEECIKLRNGDVKTEKEKTKITNSLYRYYTRMYTRSTPFGLFSTSEVGRWKEEPFVNSERPVVRHTRLDMHFLQQMIAVLCQISYIDDVLLYHPNNSIYVTGTELRYIEYSYLHGVRRYKISAVANNDYIAEILLLSNKGQTKGEMIKAIVEKSIPEADAKIFIEELIKSQLLISEFEVALTGNDDFAPQIANHLEAIYQRSGSWYVRSILEFFKGVLDDIKALDITKSNQIVAYKNIIEKLKQLQPVIDEGKTFHIDSYRMGEQPLPIRATAKGDLEELLQYFMRINGGMILMNKNLEEFKAKFSERYEMKTVPLIEALDTDIGIGYPVNRKSTTSPLVDDIPFKQREADMQVQLNAVERWVFDILKSPDNAGAFSIELEKQKQPAAHSAKIPVNWQYVPRSFSAIFRLLDDEQNTMYFEGFFGPSASSLLARFTYGDQAIKEAVSNIVKQEEEALEGAIFAEIVHLPDNRVTNVIMHPHFRKYEIPYLATPTATDENVLHVNDLYLKLENGEIVLFSKKLNKRILPRKTHMHNHVANSLPLYNFLADLQDQGENRSMGFFGRELMKLFVFLPRFTYKGMIISPAMWNLPPELLDLLKQEPGDAVHNILQKIRKQHNIPDCVLYTEGDNELLVDFTNESSVLIWLNLLKNKQSLLLKEFLWSGNHSSNAYIHQYIASIVNLEKKTFDKPIIETGEQVQTAIQRSFGIGSQWLYLKLYCGVGSVDLLMIKTITPIIKSLINSGLIKEWFFIKYYDSDYHIRLRLRIADVTQIHTVLSFIYQAIDTSSEKLLIWKIQPGVYEREIERYGENSMELCESIFFIDSTVTVELLRLLQNGQNTTMAFLWATKLVDDFLDAFQLSLKEKMDFAELIRNGYQQEFNAGKETNDRVNQKYNQYKKVMHEILGNDDPEGKRKQLYSIAAQKIQWQMPAIAEINRLKNQQMLMVRFTNLLSSLIHMMLNRLLTNKERIHELLVYEFLCKYYTMLTHKKKNEV